MTDPFFGAPQFDVDEWRSEPVRHRYVHGSFAGTDTRFSLYFPPAEHYAGRMLHTLEGGSGGSELTATGALGFGAFDLATKCGAYLIESNQGHIGEDLSGLRGEASVLGWRASAQTARLSKDLAKEMYGEAPHHSYVFGGSGGGIRSILCLENTDDVWDGAVPFMFPHQMTLEFFATQLNAVRILSPDQQRAVDDALDVGGSGQPFDGLTTEQREVLASLYRLGFPHLAWLEDPMEARYVWTWDASWLTAADAEYFDDFWAVKGYLGCDEPARLAPSVIEMATKVSRVVTAGDLSDASRLAGRADPKQPVGIAVEGLTTADDRLIGATIKVTSGPSAGNEVYCLGMVGDVLTGNSTGWLFQDLSPGDDVYIENRKFLAFCHYDRHQASNDFAEQNHARVDGLAVYPQRPEFNVAEALHGRYRYSFAGKMIAIMNTLDRGAWPCGGVRYHERAKRAFGDRLDTHFRLWWNDNASHMPPSWGPPRMTTRTVDYIGSVHQAVFDVIDWVEYAKEPPATTSYRYSDDSKLTLASAAADRHGIQPVVTLTANGAGRADVSVGEVVTLEAIAEVPGGTGKIVSVEWDFDGEGAWPEQDGSVDGTTDTTRTTRSHRYDTRGTYFPVVRVHAHRSGDVDATLGRVANLARARVVVS